MDGKTISSSVPPHGHLLITDNFPNATIKRHGTATKPTDLKSGRADYVMG